jgi:hypothetical protein
MKHFIAWYWVSVCEEAQHPMGFAFAATVLFPYVMICELWIAWRNEVASRRLEIR